jgi:biotin synthase
MPAQPAALVSAERFPAPIRHDWSIEQAEQLLRLPFNDLLFMAQDIHRRDFDPNEVQISSLLSIKTGACAEDCAYCPQSAHYDTPVGREALMPVDEVLQAADAARRQGATRSVWGPHGEARRTVTSSA